MKNGFLVTIVYNSINTFAEKFFSYQYTLRTAVKDRVKNDRKKIEILALSSRFFIMPIQQNRRGKNFPVLNIFICKQQE